MIIQSIPQVAKCISPNCRLKATTKQYVIELLGITCNKIMSNYKTTVDAAVRDSFIGEVAPHALAEGHKAVSTEGKKLLFKVQDVRKGFLNKDLSANELIFLTAVLEYITWEVFEVGSFVTQTSNRKLITPEDIKTAFITDDEIRKSIFTE